MLNQSWRIDSRPAREGLGILLALIIGPLGCSQGPVCKELASCGGDPVGKWAGLPRGQETPGTYCQESIHTPPQEGHLREQPIGVARQRPPEKATADWCSDLTVTGDLKEAVKRHNYWWEDLPYIAGFLEYQSDGTYRANMTRKAFVDRWFSPVCLRKYGYGGDCKQFQADLERANQGAGEYNSFNCNTSSRGGCDCNFEIFEVNTLLGSYSRTGDTFTHFPASPTAHFSQASFCVSGDRLTISGKNNSFLWDRSGLRSIELVRMNCSDGVAGPGELGIDCGLGCPNACPITN